jgi:hypothetical protein
MAFRAFDDWERAVAVEPPPVAAPASASASPDPVFTPAERHVIAVARIDGPGSVRPRTVLTRLAGALFGMNPPNPLADPRLEALRRFAVLARVSGGDVPRHEIDRFLAAGFTPGAALALASPVP